jgi:uncharacterized protein (TIGR00251 family)
MVTTDVAPCFRWDDETLVVEIRLQPRASDNALMGISNGRLRIRVTAAPVDNAANQKMIALLAKAFGVAKSRVHLLAGASNRDKRVAIERPTKLPEAIRTASQPRICAGRATP